MAEDRTAAFTEDPFKATGHSEINLSPRILVVGNDATLRGIHVQILKTAGYTVEAVANDAGILAVLEASQYDLLVTDNHLPGVPGLDLIKTLSQAGSRLPIILITNVAPPSAPYQSLQMKVVLLQPHTADELVAKVRNILNAMSNGPGLKVPLYILPAALSDGLRL